MRCRLGEAQLFAVGAALKLAMRNFSVTMAMTIGEQKAKLLLFDIW